jgi:hypothetical protein
MGEIIKKKMLRTISVKSMVTRRLEKTCPIFEYVAKISTSNYLKSSNTLQQTMF